MKDGSVFLYGAGTDCKSVATGSLGSIPSRSTTEPRKPPYPFCSHPEKCIAAGRCARTVRGEPWSCAD